MKTKFKNLGSRAAAVTLSVLMAASSFTGCGTAKIEETTLSEKVTLGNPVVGGLQEDGTYLYGGDPAAYVDGDTVYLYTGHDISTDKEVSDSIYHIPEYFCYSSTDMINWKSEGVCLSMHDVDWCSNSTSAWASQVTKYKDKYYLYYCSWDKLAAGKQSIGVAVADAPTGPFVDIGEPLVRGFVTKPQTNNWNDIDPTVWVETDDKGEEHRYLAWGNSLFYICELNEDMISVKDQNGDGEITCGLSIEDADIINRTSGIEYYTEAPWLYRRQDENGKYYGDYYLFYAYNWREGMSYATTDDLLSGEWKNGGKIMNPTSTSNTNHEAVIDFKGKTYFIYHNGSLPAGSGFRRSACIQELKWNDDGTVEFMEETSSGLGGKATFLKAGDDTNVAHEHYDNAHEDSSYPYTKVKVGSFEDASATDQMWVMNPGKADPANEAYVSIQSENKSGLYLTAGEDGSITLAQDTDAKEETLNAQTFKTMTPANGKEGYYTFESVAKPGFYLTLKDGTLTLSDKADANGSSFKIDQKTKDELTAELGK
ncbi:MAG: family 43 glycosylhydrolase [Lachnospiraceae bacterium]|nr:family 43 glycosylhydrolase [Lachnospiraceae bacterium]